MSDKCRYVVWFRAEGSTNEWAPRLGRYKNKEAAIDAIKNIAVPGYTYIHVPEHTDPNRRSRVKK